MFSGLWNLIRKLKLNVFIVFIRFIILIFFQIRVDLGLADHVWQDKRAAFAQTVDTLGDQFRPAMHAGWLSYIQQAYPDGAAVSARLALG